MKSRGKTIETGKLVYGYQVKLLDNSIIIVEEAAKTTKNHPHYPSVSLGKYHEVIPESVGDYAGFNDCQGQEIYTGMKVKGRYPGSDVGTVVLAGGCFRIDTGVALCNYLYLEIMGD